MLRYKYLHDNTKIYVVVRKTFDPTNVIKKQIYSEKFYSSEHNDLRNAVIAYVDPSKCLCKAKYTVEHGECHTTTILDMKKVCNVLYMPLIIFTSDDEAEVYYYRNRNDDDDYLRNLRNKVKKYNM